MGQSTVQATGGFQVPNVDDHFDEVEKGPKSKKEEITTQKPKKEKGFWEKVGDGISSAADWVTDTASDAWETAKNAVSDAGDWISETASDLWDSTKNVFSDAVDWVSDTASDIWDWIVDVGVTTWDWIVENKEYIGAVVTIIAGAILCFVPGGQIIGISMLIGSGIAGGVAWFSGADGKEIAFDMFLGGLTGGASGGIGGIVANGIRASATSLLTRFSPFVQKFLPEAIGAGAAGFTESALWDKLKNGEVNWKKAAVSAGLCFTLVFGAAKVGPKIINGINNIPIPPVFQTVVQTTGGDMVTAGPQTIGETSFGQWLQKFAVNTNNGGNQSTNTTASNSAQTNTVIDNVVTDGSHISANGTLRPNTRYQTGEYDYLYETDNLGRITEVNAEELRLTERGGRLPHKANTPGKESGDHAGHLIGDRFGGSPELDNIVSQASRVNLSTFKRLENEWARALANGQDVSVNIRVNYEGGNVRPSSFEVEYTIDGVDFSQEIPN